MKNKIKAFEYNQTKTNLKTHKTYIKTTNNLKQHKQTCKKQNKY